MKHSTVRVLSILATVFFCAAAAVLCWFIYQVVSAGSQLTERAEAIATMNASLKANAELGVLMGETQQERSVLSELVLTEEGTSMFLTEIESIAARTGVSLSTRSLEVIEKKDAAHDALAILLHIEGRTDLVLLTVKLLEVLPYHSMVRTLDLQKKADQTAEAQLELVVTLKK